MPAALIGGPKQRGGLSREQSMISRGPFRGLRLPAAPWSGTWPAPQSTLDLDFVNDRGWVRGVGQGRVMDAITFTRATSGTFVGSDGLLKTALAVPEVSTYEATTGTAGSVNWITYSNDFTQTVWGKTNVTVTANTLETTDPFGGNNASKIYETTASGNHSFGITSGPGGNANYSIYIKYAGKENISFATSESSAYGFTTFNTLTGRFTSGSFTVNPTVESVGNGWWRLSFVSTRAFLGPAVRFYVFSDSTIDNYVGDGVSGVYVYGGQVESDITINNTPRFDWGSTVTIPRRNFFSSSDTASSAVNGSFTDASPVTDIAQIPMQEYAIGGATLPAISGVAKDWTSQAALLLSRTLSVYVQPGLNRYIYFSSNMSSTQSNVGAKYRYDTVDATTTLLYEGNISRNVKVINLSGGLYRVVMNVQQFTNSGGKTFGVYCSNTAESTGANSYITASTAPTGNFSVGGWMVEDAGSWDTNPDPTVYQANGNVSPNTLPLAANPTSNGLLMEEARTNSLLWCRDATNTPFDMYDMYDMYDDYSDGKTATNLLVASFQSAAFFTVDGTIGNTTSMYNTDVDLIANGGPSFIDTTGWTIAAGSGTFSIVSGKLRLTSITTNGRGYTSFSTVIGDYYEVIVPFEYVSGSTNVTHTLRCRIGTIAGNLNYIYVSQALPPTPNSTFRFVFKAKSTTSYLWLQHSASASNQVIDYVSVTVNKIVSDNVLDALGGNTASTAVATSANAEFIKPTETNTGPHTFSVWLRRKTGTGDIQITAGSSTPTWETQTITSSWARYSVSQSTSGTLINPGIRIVSAGDEIEVWRPQLVPGFVVTDYQPTQDIALFGWSRSNVAVAKDQTGIDGVANAATSITANANDAVLIQPVVATSSSRSVSVFLKRITGTGIVQVSIDGSTWSTVDLSDTEWRRVSLVASLANPVLGIRLQTSGDAVAMDFGQIEGGAISFATTPILTTTTAATRSSDTWSLPAETWVNNSAGTVVTTAYAFGEIGSNTSALELTRTGAVMPVVVDNIPIDTTGSAQRFRPRVVDGGIVVFDLNGSYGENYPFAYDLIMSWNRANVAVSVNGKNRFGNTGVDSGRYSNAPSGLKTLVGSSGRTRNIKKITYFPIAVSQDSMTNL